MKETFVFYKSWMEALTDVPDDVRLEVYDCIIEYAFSGKVPSLKPMAKMAFNFIKNDIDRASEKYKKIVDRNKNNGAKGGRPKNHTNPKNPVGFSETQENPNEYDNDNDNEYDNNILLEKESKVENIIKENSREVFPEKTIEVNTESEEKEKSSAKKEKVTRSVFKPPSVQEVQEYCNERQNGISGYSFVNFYQSKGWMVGSNKMKDWKAAIRTWEQKNKENGKSNYQNSNNGFSNSAGNTGGGVKASGKVSARTLLARRITESSSGNSQSGNTTIDIEAIQ